MLDLEGFPWDPGVSRKMDRLIDGQVDRRAGCWSRMNQARQVAGFG